MSFSANVKRELCRIEIKNKEEARAVLCGIFKSSASLSLAGNRNINVKSTTENPAIARFIFKVLKEHFNIHTRVMVRRSNSLKKNNIYMIMISHEMGAVDFLKEISVLKDEEFISVDYSVPKEIVDTEEHRRAFIRGAFLGGGSINNPEKNYHIEFVTHNEDYANRLKDVVNGYKVNAKVINRKNSYVVYIKEADKIVDTLNVIGAHKHLLEFENVRIMKGMRNNINRLVNCETANLSKTVNAAVRQIESIKLIESELGLQRLPVNLREVAKLRMEYPDISLKELGELLDPPVGKSGINHRLRKIEKIASELR